MWVKIRIGLIIKHPDKFYFINSVQTRHFPFQSIITFHHFVCSFLLQFRLHFPTESFISSHCVSTFLVNQFTQIIRQAHTYTRCMKIIMIIIIIMTSRKNEKFHVISCAHRSLQRLHLLCFTVVSGTARRKPMNNHGDYDRNKWDHNNKKTKTHITRLPIQNVLPHASHDLFITFFFSIHSHFSFHSSFSFNLISLHTLI